MEHETRQGVTSSTALSIILVLIILTGGVYVFYKKPSIVGNSQTPSLTPILTTTPDPTADWSVYRSEEYGYTIKYPANWHVIEKSSYNLAIESVEGERIDVFTQNNPEKLSLEDWLAQVSQKKHTYSFENKTFADQSALLDFEKTVAYITAPKGKVLSVIYISHEGPSAQPGKDKYLFVKILQSIVFNINNDLIITKSFPGFDQLSSVYSDPYDADTLWFRGIGGIIKYNLKTKAIERILIGDDGIHNSPTSVVRNGDHLFVGYQGGFQKINLVDGKLTNYDVKKGLINGSNIELSPDLFNANIIWIGTFNGISKFNIIDNSFINFGGEFGELGGCSKWSIPRLEVEKDYVWIHIVAHANCRGGIARYDKNTRNWKAWGPGAFGKDSRIDFNGITADGEKAFVIESRGEIYKYIPELDKWQIILESQPDAYKKSPTYFNNKLYFISFAEGASEAKYINLENGLLYSLNLFDYDRIYNDKLNRRLIFGNVNGEIATLSDMGSISSVFVKRPKEFEMKALIFADEDFIFFRDATNMFVYKINSGSLSKLKGIQFNSQEQKVIPIRDKFVIIDFPFCEHDCTDGLLTVLNKDFTIDRAVAIEERSSDGGILLNKNLSEFLFLGRNGAKYNVTRFDYQTADISKFEVDANSTFSEEQYISTDSLSETKNTIVSSKYGSFSAQMSLNQVGEGNEAEFEVRYKEQKGADLKTIQVAPPSYNPFGGAPSTRIHDAKFDSLDTGESSILWIGTDRGLIKYNFKTDTSRLFTTENGLANNQIDLLFSIKNKLIISHPTGTYIYDTDFRGE